MSSIPPIIVIVEDSRVQGRILQQRLNAASYEAHIGENGELALQLVHKLKPAVVISDIEMPKMNGYELCSEMPHKPF